MVKNLDNLYAYEIANLLAENKITPIILTEYYIEKYMKSDENTKLSFSKLIIDDALKEAKLSWQRQKLEKRLSFFDGMPIAWKDVIDLSNAPALAGSNLLKHRRNTRNIDDAHIVKLAKKNGLVSLAKTGTVEFAFGGLGTNQYNTLPENLLIKGGFAPGGSSTGSATAVYSGLIPFAVGTDTAGSVRIPAAWHGLVGFKPTLNLISRKGILPLSPSYDTVGIICKCVKDTQLLFNLLAEKKFYYRNCNKEKVNISIVKDFNLNDLNSKNYNIYNDFFDLMKSKGYDLSNINIPEFKEINDCLLNIGSIVNYEAWGCWKHLLTKNQSAVDKNVISRFNLGKKIKKTDYNFLIKKIYKLRKRIEKRISNIDFLIMPTISDLPPSLNEIKDANTYIFYNNKVLNNTRIANICNFSAISIPIYKSEKSCWSISIFSKPNQDKKLLCLAEKIESILV